MTEIKQIFRTPEQFLEQKLEVAGWVRNIRVSKKFGFIELNDGSFFQNLQIVFEEDLGNFEEIATYTDTTDQTQNVLWFENEQSVKAKAQLARLLQLRGLSLWRLGTIPTDSNTGLNIWQAVQSSVQ